MVVNSLDSRNDFSILLIFLLECGRVTVSCWFMLNQSNVYIYLLFVFPSHGVEIPMPYSSHLTYIVQ